MGHGRDGGPLESPLAIRVSPSSLARPGHSTPGSDRRDPDGPCSSSLASAGVVRRAVTSRGGPPQRAAPLENPAETAASRSVSPGSRGVQTSRLATIEQSLRTKGFSKHTAFRVARATRDSTSNLYQAKWAQFCSWCRGRTVNPLRATLPLIADFFVHLREQRQMSSSAIKGYRSALAPVFLHRGLDISSDPALSALFRNFDQEVVRPVVRTPKWDVNIVLQSLLKAPYEPMATCSLRSLTLKTVFLLALASSKRVSELHGLSYLVSWSGGGKKATLSLSPEFVAKTQKPGDPATAYGPVHIPALSSQVGPGEPDALLCPLRALQAYLTRTAASRPSCHRLFVSTVAVLNHKLVSKNTISFWIKSVIRHAYDSVSDPDIQLWKASAHEVRAIATSLRFRQNSSIAEVMSAASWRSRSTFAAFYLRDIDLSFLDSSTLGPVVAAQAVVGTAAPSSESSHRPKKSRGGAKSRK